MAEESSPDDRPPAYFLSLTLENVRCFGPEQTLDLSDEDGRPAQWTVLLGDNGAGKTTILQAIAALVIDVERADDLEEFYGAAFPEDEPFWAKGPAILGLRRDAKGWVSFRRSSTEMAVMKAKYFSGALLAEEYGEELPASFGVVVKESGIGIETGEKGYPDTNKIRGLHCVGYGASRTMSQGGAVFPEESEELAPTAGLFSDTESLPNVVEWLHQLNYASESGKKSATERLRLVESALTNPDDGVLPDVDDLRFRGSDRDDMSPPHVEFKTPYGWVTIDQLSLGYRTMIAWVVDLARRLFDRYPESDNPLAEPAVCLVDEIDLHLHPKWQRKIIAFLSERFPNTQFIVTAHSPLVVQAAEDANIALLKRKEVEGGDDYVEIHNDMEPARNLRVDQILTSDLYGLGSARPPRLDDLMEERQKILAKSELTEEDEERLDEIEQKIGDLPSGETKEQREAMDFIERVADRLEDEK